ncbi:hypothetical protein KW787_04055 [Candidatus Pacearchaeota archaeon]|nr:hypothetical protein [Candidatus Pacearchaeota archaeon]
MKRPNTIMQNQKQNRGHGGGRGQNLSEEDRRRGGQNSANMQERDERGHFAGKGEKDKAMDEDEDL